MSFALSRAGFIVGLVVFFHLIVGLPNYTAYSFSIGGGVIYFINMFFLFFLVIFSLIFYYIFKPEGFSSQMAGGGGRIFNISEAFFFLGLFVSFIYYVIGLSGEGGFWGRFSRIPILINISQLGIPAALLMLSIFLSDGVLISRLKRFFYLAAFVLYVYFQASQGYRSPIFIVLLSGLIAYGYSRFFIAGFVLEYSFILKALLLVVLGLVMMSYVAIHRVVSDYSYVTYYYQMNWIDIPEYMDVFAPLMATIRADYIHLNLFLESLWMEPMLPGSIFFSDLITWLPGTQLGSRNIVGDYVGARDMPNGLPMSITVGLVGIVYADFGLVGLFFLAIIISYSLAYSFYKYSKGAVFYLAIFSFLMANFVKSIHSGYLDFSFYFQIASLFFILMLSKYKIIFR
jgi:hypothetical protein